MTYNWEAPADETWTVPLKVAVDAGTRAAVLAPVERG